MNKRISVRVLQDGFRLMDRTQNRNPMNQYGSTDCVYTQPGTDEHCIAGQVLAHLGVELPDTNHSLNGCAIGALIERKTRINEVGIPVPTPSFLEAQGFEITNRAFDILADVQGLADAGDTWEEALTNVKGARR